MLTRRRVNLLDPFAAVQTTSVAPVPVGVLHGTVYLANGDAEAILAPASEPLRHF